MKAPRFELLVKGNFNLEKIKIRHEKKMFKLPPFLEKRKLELIKQEKTEALKKNLSFYNDSLVRLDKYKVGSKRLFLSFIPTTWFDYIASNRQLDELMVNEKRLRSFLQGNSEATLLANPVTVTTVIVTGDSKMILTKRGKTLYQYPGKISASSSGFVNMKDIFGNTPHPFITAMREIKEELNLSVPLKNFTLTGIGKSYEYRHFQILLKANIALKGDEILNSLKPSEEIENVMLINKNKNSVQQLLKKYPANEWVPAGFFAVMRTLSLPTSS